MGDLATDTALDGGGGSYRIALSRDWEGVGTPNGGYLAAIALRAAGNEARLPKPASLSCQYLSIPKFDVVEVEVIRLRVSRRAEAFRVEISQATKPILTALVWVVAGEMDGLQHEAAPRPAVPSPDGLPNALTLWAEDEQPIAPAWRHVDCRPVDYLHVADLIPRPPVDRSWHRFLPEATYADPFLDGGRALFLIDALAYWPATRAQGIGFKSLPFFAPNIDLTAQFHREGCHAEWLLAESRSPLAAGGLVSSQVQIWSLAGELLSSGTSTLMCRPNPQCEVGSAQ